eukprot:8540409-Alexandrium_andersonii.AAC.1
MLRGAGAAPARLAPRALAAGLARACCHQKTARSHATSASLLLPSVCCSCRRCAWLHKRTQH